MGHRRVGSRGVEPDRAAAIRATIAAATVHDLIVIAGKGHETWQEQNGVRKPFSDVDEATAALALWGGP